MPCGQLQASLSQRERRCDWELERLGFKKGGGREEVAAGRMAGLESWNMEEGEGGLGTGIPGSAWK